MSWSLALLLSALACVASSVHAGRPLTIDDAEPVAHRQFEFEAGLGYVRNNGLTHFDFPFGLAYGLLPRWEIGAGFGGQIEEQKEELGAEKAVTDMGDLTLGSKLKVLTADRFWADQSLVLTVKFPTASYEKGLGTGRTDFDLMWIVSKALTKKCNLHLNIGHTWTGDRSDETFADVLHYGLAVDYQVAAKWQLVAEVFAETPLITTHDVDAHVRGGVRWQLTDSLVLDAAIGGGLRRPAPDVTATVGLTWTFGPGK
ncbi:MAG: transporter [Verrucomicrobia bacterium]|nr:transporter [Verrucomicrobiota bacterium]